MKYLKGRKVTVSESPLFSGARNTISQPLLWLGQVVRQRPGSEGVQRFGREGLFIDMRFCP